MKEEFSPDFWMAKRLDSDDPIYIYIYQRDENSEYIIWNSGVILYDRKRADILSLAKMAFQRKLDYNRLSGFYRVVAYDKRTFSWLFFGDDTGSQYLFIDESRFLFGDRFLNIIRQRNNDWRLDIHAVAHLIDHGRFFENRTLACEIKKTDPDSWYLLLNGSICCYSKNLVSFSNTSELIDLKTVVSSLVEAVGEQNICAVCTGGTDSRSVLSALKHIGVDPALVITGHSDNPDIAVAKEVASQAGCDLTVIEPSERVEDWLYRGLELTDGMFDVVLSYRQYLKATWALEHGFAYEFGGVAGEYYKNSFCMPIRWGLLRKKDADYLYRNLLKKNRSQQSWCGNALKNAGIENRGFYMELAQAANHESSLLEKCNRVGSSLIRASVGSITNGYSAMSVKLDPLMDRTLAATASHEGYIGHCMHRWQRHQISKLYPKLGEIPTDQGYSCSVKPLVLLLEYIRKLVFYTGRVVQHIRRKVGLGFKSAQPHYWDNDLAEARNTPQWQTAKKICVQQGIIRSDITDEDIPIEHTGEILLIGMIDEYTR